MTLTKLLIWANVAAFGWLVLGAGFGAVDGSAPLRFYYDHGALLGVAVSSGGQGWRIVSSAFLHGSVIHIGVNMYALYIVGSDVERLMGPVRYVALYAIAMVGSGLAVVFFDPAVVTLGASGAIFGLFGALVGIGLSLLPRGMTIVTQSLPVIVLNLAIGFAVPGISNTAHIGGLVAGFVAGWLLYQIPSQRRAAVYAALNPEQSPVHVETIEHPPDAGPHEEEGAPPLEVRDPRE